MEGLLLIDKPEGPTSHDIVDQVRRVTGLRAVGHAGTLDPFASGLLLLGLGKATKRLSAFVGCEKIYETTLMLGAISDTYDPTGIFTTLPPIDHWPDRTRIEEVLKAFQPGYAQKAPIYSAKKIQGKKLYEFARQGKSTEDMRPTKYVKLPELILTDHHPPLISLRIRCSSGTYIRSLGHDIGQALGTGAYLTALRRKHIGPFSVSDALTLEQLTKEAIQASIDKEGVN